MFKIKNLKKNIHVILFLYLFLFFKLFSQNNEFKKDYLIISLGYNCRVAAHINFFKLSEFSFPFNWLQTSFEGLYRAFEKDFENFFDRNNLFDEGTLKGYSHRIIKDQLYDITSYHDFPVNDYMSGYDKVKEKFEIRIKRLYRALNSNKLVYLIRTEIAKYETKFLVDLINSKFPSLNYIFVAIGSTDEFKENWHMDKVKNFYLEDYNTKWFSPNNWKKIFQKLNLIDDNFQNEINIDDLLNQNYKINELIN